MTKRNPQHPFSPPVGHEDMVMKERMAKDAWTTRDPGKVTLADTLDWTWRNRSAHRGGRAQVDVYLTEKWAAENGRRLVREIRAPSGTRIALRFCDEWNDQMGQGYCAHDNATWECGEPHHMAVRQASLTVVPDAEADQKFLWAKGPRPSETPWPRGSGSLTCPTH